MVTGGSGVGRRLACRRPTDGNHNAPRAKELRSGSLLVALRKISNDLGHGRCRRAVDGKAGALNRPLEGVLHEPTPTNSVDTTLLATITEQSRSAREVGLVKIKSQMRSRSMSKASSLAASQLPGLQLQAYPSAIRFSSLPAPLLAQRSKSRARRHGGLWKHFIKMWPSL